MKKNVFFIIFLISQIIANPFEFNISTQQGAYFFNNVTLNGNNINSEDWVGAFNGETCIGATQWDTSECNGGVCSININGFDINIENTLGYIQTGEFPTFKIYDASENIYLNANPSNDLAWHNQCLNIIESLSAISSIDGCDLPDSGTTGYLHLTSEGSVLYKSPEAIGGFQFDVIGATVSSGSGGDAGSAGLLVQSMGSTVLAFSLSGSTIPAGCGTLVNLALSGEAAGLTNIVVSDAVGGQIYFEYYEGGGSEDVEGCTDMSACNYDMDATVDDGSCDYPEENFDCDGNCTVEIDCAGECGGSAELDECGVCGGDGSECDNNICLDDCPGVENIFDTSNYQSVISDGSDLCNWVAGLETNSTCLDDCDEELLGDIQYYSLVCESCVEIDVCDELLADSEDIIECQECGVDFDNFPEINFEEDPVGFCNFVTDLWDNSAECLINCNNSEAVEFAMMAAFCGDCAGLDIPEGECDCNGNVDLGCGCGEPGPSGCDNQCGSTAEFDECGVCGGDGNSCILGCIDMVACNYNMDAAVDDGSCDYPEENYDCEGNCIAEIDCEGNCGGNAVCDGICSSCLVIYDPEISGGITCCDELLAVFESCSVIELSLGFNCSGCECGGDENFESQFGCTDPLACNYDENAIVNDGAIECEFAPENYDCEGNCLVQLDCEGNCGGELQLDCFGECGGSAVLDECGECNGDGIDEGQCDCDGNIDLGCGCGEAGPSGCDEVCESVLELDCLGECGGSAELDECGVCGGDGIADGACDCDGNIDLGCGCGEVGPSGCDEICGSTIEFDECGICGGDGPHNSYDCNDIPDLFFWNQSENQATYLINTAYGLCGEMLTPNEDWIGVFNGDVCVGSELWTGTQIELMAMGYDANFYSQNYLTEGKTPNFKVYDYSEDLYIDIIFEEGGYQFSNQSIHEIELLSIEDSNFSLHINGAANLISFYKLPFDKSVSNVLSNLSNSVVGIISENSSALHSGDGLWYGSLSHIENDKGYWILTNNPFESSVIDFNGFECYDNYKYNLKTGSNLISFPKDGLYDINTVILEEYLSNFDVIIGQNQSALNSANGWLGSLTHLQGGSGYWMIVKDSIDFYYNFSNSLIRNTLNYREDLPGNNKYNVYQSTQQAFYYVDQINLISDIVDNGDWLMAYNDNVIAGIRQWNGEIIDVPAMGNTDSNLNYGYFREGDIPRFKLLKKSNGRVIDLIGDVPEWSFNSINMIANLSELIINPLEFNIDRAYPNPFNPITAINFEIPYRSNVIIEIYNLKGCKVDELINGSIDAGYYSVNWNAGSYSSGAYFLKMVAGRFTSTQKLILLK